MIAPQYAVKSFSCIFHDEYCTNINAYIFPEICTFHLAYRFGIREQAVTFPRAIERAIGAWSNIRGYCLFAFSVHGDEIVFDQGDTILPVASYAKAAFDAEKQNEALFQFKDEHQFANQRQFALTLSLYRLLEKIGKKMDSNGVLYPHLGTFASQVLSRGGINMQDIDHLSAYLNNSFCFSKQFMKAYRQDKNKDSQYQVHEKPWNKIDMATLKELHELKPSAVAKTQLYMSMVFPEKEFPDNDCFPNIAVDDIFVNRMRDMMRDLFLESEQYKNEFAQALLRVLLNQYDPYKKPHNFVVFSFFLSSRVLNVLMCCGLPIATSVKPILFDSSNLLYDYLFHEKTLHLSTTDVIYEKKGIGSGINTLLPKSHTFKVTTV